MTNEPVLTATAAAAIVSAVVALGEITGLYHAAPDAVAAIVGGVAVVATMIAGWLARRKVTPVAKKP